MKCVMETEHKLFSPRILELIKLILKKAPTIKIAGAF